MWEPPLIAADRITLGTLAQRYGYRTACIGKWHLGWDWPIPADRTALFRQKPVWDEARPQPDEVLIPPEPQRALWHDVFSRPIAGGPMSRGFDHYFGVDLPSWPPFCFIEDDCTVGIPSEFLPLRLVPAGQASRQGPAVPGWTMEPILPTLGDRAVAFIAAAAAANAPFLLYLPLTSPHTPLAVNEAWREKSGLNRYADFVMETDAVVGHVLDALDRGGVAEKTLVVFTSDNGCAPNIGMSKLKALGHDPSGPLRGAKADAWEGGHRVPFVVRWPGVTAPGSVCHELVHQADLLRTFADVLGAPLPDDAGEDSVSILPLINGAAGSVRELAVSTGRDGTPALRRGQWKYIAASDSGGATAGGHESMPVQLYDLSSDLGEQKNLAGEQPERVAEMQALLERLITAGRSTPGLPQVNDVDVVRYPRPPAAASP